MPVMTDVLVNAAAGTKFAGRFNGKTHEYAPYDCMLTLLASSAQIDTSVTLNIGGEVVVDDQVISGSNRFPLMPDDLVIRHPIRKGQRIIYDVRTVTATGASPAGVKSAVILDPI